jgi:hypothetical protein
MQDHKIIFQENFLVEMLISMHVKLLGGRFQHDLL